MNEFSIDIFKDKIRTTKSDYRVRASYKSSGDTTSRRIAILVSQCYLESGGDIHWSIILEKAMYNEVRFDKMECDPIPEELHIVPSLKRPSTKKLNPLKLSLESNVDLRGIQYIPYFIYTILNLLKGENTNGSHEVGSKFQRKHSPGKDRKPNQSRTFNGNIQGKPIYSVFMAERRWTSSCKTRKKVLGN